MLPRTILLTYSPDYETHGLPLESPMTLPNMLHTRASRLMSYVEESRAVAKAVLRSEYDAVYDICLTMTLDNTGHGLVTHVKFVEVL